MPVSDFLDMMPFTLTHESVTAFDAYGKPSTYATAVSYRCRVSYKLRRTVSRVNGADVISNSQAWLNGVIPSLALHDRITLPDGSTPILVNWDVVPDESANHHMKLYFGGA